MKWRWRPGNRWEYYLEDGEWVATIFVGDSITDVFIVGMGRYRSFSNRYVAMSHVQDAFR